MYILNNLSQFLSNSSNYTKDVVVFFDRHYKVKITSKTPAIFDMRTSRFDSMSVQEAFDACFRGDTSYLIEDLIDYKGMDDDEASKLVEHWSYNLDLIILENCNYAKHTIEYIIPNSEFFLNKGHEAKIKIIEKL